MSETELNARIEIATKFLHGFIDRPLHMKMFGPQNSDEWLHSIGFYDDGAILPNNKHTRWRLALGLEPQPKEYRYFHDGKLMPIGVRTMNLMQFREYETSLNQ